MTKLGQQMSKSVTGSEVGLAVLVAMGLDTLGEPPATLHPVVWYGKVIRLLERAAPAGRLPQLVYGIAMPLLAAPLAILPALEVQRLALRMLTYATKHGQPIFGKLLYALLIGACLKPFFAANMLVAAGREVRYALEGGELQQAREALGSLVSRDREQLTPELVIAAAVESLAENVSDSVVAPLFYYALFGLPGAAFYRLCNTFDSMIGYHGHYEYLGKAAARLDDLLNLVPARLSALLIVISTATFGGSWRTALRTWLRDAGNTASPNAGHPMAAMAGALGVQLEKVDHYRLGNATRRLVASDIQKAEVMVRHVSWISVLLVVCYKFLRSGRR